jgi:predicted DNA-binding ribbon-helix-helix protein
MLARVRGNGAMLKSKIVKRSIAIAGHRTSISVEDEFWNALKEIARRRHMTLGGIVGRINEKRQFGNLSSAIRLFVLGFYRDKTAQRSELNTAAINRELSWSLGGGVAP